MTFDIFPKEIYPAVNSGRPLVIAESEGSWGIVFDGDNDGEGTGAHTIGPILFAEALVLFNTGNLISPFHP